ncbi:MAG TPA: metallophosphoesterase [Anaerolineales bacterium]|nr:metallophosphoesterase [Anaerolineales bacterium]
MRRFSSVLGVLLDFVLPVGDAKSYRSLAEANWFKVETVRLELKRLSDVFSGLRVAQISDIHMGGWMNIDRLQLVADWLMTQKPEVLLITGDFLIGRGFTEISELWINDLTRVLSPLASSIPSFAVLGNHDYWTNPNAVRRMLFRSGITDLTNTVFTLRLAGESLHLCGVDDIRAGDVRLEQVTAQLNDNSAAILLVHEPDFADVSAAIGKFDLQVSGHTHGGQIVLPFIGAPMLPYLGRKYPSGLYKVGNMYQYTNRGLGANSIALRWNCPPEVTIFVLDSIAS